MSHLFLGAISAVSRNRETGYVENLRLDHTSLERFDIA